MTNVDDRKAEDMSLDEIELETNTLIDLKRSVGWNEAQAARFEYIRHHPTWDRVEAGSDEGLDYTPPPLPRSLFRIPDPLPSDPVVVRARARTRVPKKGGICHQFRNNGSCKFGKRCRYAHIAPTSPGRGSLRGRGSGLPPAKSKPRPPRKVPRALEEGKDTELRLPMVAPTPPDSAAPPGRGSLRGRGPGLPPAKRKPRPPRKVQRALEEGKDTELRPPVVAADSVTVSKGVVLCVVVAVVVSFACAVAGTYWLMR